MEVNIHSGPTPRGREESAAADTSGAATLRRASVLRDLIVDAALINRWKSELWRVLNQIEAKVESDTVYQSWGLASAASNIKFRASTDNNLA